MSDKPKVYQGVRVKATVKELLQKRRALQAAIKREAKISQSMATQDVSSPSFPAYHFDVCPGNSMPDSNSFQPQQYTDNVCNIPVETSGIDNQQFINMMLPPENFSNNSLPVASSAQYWNQGNFPSNSEYYNQGMAANSPSDSMNLPSPIDYNSYSPPQSYSSSSSCYSSPTRMDSSFNLVPEFYHFQHCSPQHCYCVSHWFGPQEDLTNLEYTAYCTPDSAYTSAVEESYFRRPLSNSEMCYL
ncbi:colorectal cancer associated 2 isoform X2 [Conger conger]|uniref:colorectal cancer associated 2 isoform X2 n=1 Tax=Conger conger TaxID=82655 RepID=UPI002A5A73C9|nr:colorectal cancer associated 2 isoform X2 [Conger conger]